MHSRTYLGLWLVIGGGGCSAPTTAGVSPVPPSDAGARFPGVDAASSSDAGVALVDASACAPGNVSSFVPVYKPSPRYADACTTDQLATVIRDCFDSATDSQRACDAWGANSRNRDCFECWSGPITSATSDAAATTTWAPYGFVKNPGQTTYVNVSGCIVLAAPNELPCAQAIQNDFACELDACEATCPVPASGSTTSAMTALEGCFESANEGSGCAVYAKGAAGAMGATACAARLAASGPAAFCFDAEMEEPQALLEYFTLACGAPPPEDGGEGGEAGGASDAASGSEADAP
jgi:hypothetical protein